jgi:hypothetical protein
MTKTNVLIKKAEVFRSVEDVLETIDKKVDDVLKKVKKIKKSKNKE